MPPTSAPPTVKAVCESICQHIWCSLGKGLPFPVYQSASHLRAFAPVVSSERKALSLHTTWLTPSSTNPSKNVTTWALVLVPGFSRVAPS